MFSLSLYLNFFVGSAVVYSALPYIALLLAALRGEIQSQRERRRELFARFMQFFVCLCLCCERGEQAKQELK